MEVAEGLRAEQPDPSLSPEERAHSCVRISIEHSDRGDHEAAKSLLREALALFEESRDSRGAALARVELARCHWRGGSFEEAHEELERALAEFTTHGDRLRAAVVHETRARVFLDEGRLQEARASARAAVRAFEQEGEAAPLFEAMVTLGTALARSGRGAEACELLLRTVTEAEAAGEREAAGLATLALAEEAGEELAAREFGELYDRASRLLADSRRPGVRERLSECALRFIKARASSLGISEESDDCEEGAGLKHGDWDGFSLKREVLRYEAELIERALREADGSVSRAAKLLGFRHHQTFVALLNNRHRELLHVRNPIIHRRVKAGRPRTHRRATQRQAESEAQRNPTILVAENDRLVAEAVRDVLEFEGWSVQTCGDGATALMKVEGAEHFDLLLLGEELPGVGGLEVARHARSLAHRRSTPVVLISASDSERAALEAGADAFVRKPQDVLALVPLVSQLLGLEVEA